MKSPLSIVETFKRIEATGVVITERSGRILYCNKYIHAKLGYSTEEIGKINISAVIPGCLELVSQDHKPDNISQTAKYNTIDAVKQDGTALQVSLAIRNWKTEQGVFVVFLIYETAPQKSCSDDVLKLNDTILELINQNQLLKESLQKESTLNELNSRFISLASHEFRTPLNNIQSSAYLMSQYTKAEEKEKREKHFKRITSSVSLLTDILANFLFIGKIEEGEIKAQLTYHNIKSFTQNIIEDIEDQMKSGQHIVYKHTGNEAALFDNMLYKYIVFNLLTNAIKFSPEHSNIIVTTRAEVNMFSLSVKDNGIGISEEDQVCLFERYFRGKNVGTIKGTGLGLFIISKYVELMHGKINCLSTLGEGTEFIIRFNPAL